MERLSEAFKDSVDDLVAPVVVDNVALEVETLPWMVVPGAEK